MNKPFPVRIVRHPALTPSELAALFCIDEDELPKSAYNGLLALIEGMILQRCPGYHCEYVPTKSSPAAEGYALVLHLIREDAGFTPERIEKARKYLGYPHPPLTELLAVFFKTRTAVREYQLTQAQNRAA